MILSYSISIILIFCAYLLGSIPSGYLAGRWLKDIDIREHGSKSTGATNVLRTLGKTAAITVLIADILKGAISVGLVKLLYTINTNPILPDSWQYILVVIAATAAIIGHSKSIFLNFTGGKSVATTIGVLFVMNSLVAGCTFAIFALFLSIFRIVSLGSIAGAVAVIILMIAFNQPLPYIIFAVFTGIYVIIRHKANIIRLLEGTEPKIGSKISSSKPETT